MLSQGSPWTLPGMGNPWNNLSLAGRKLIPSPLCCHLVPRQRAPSQFDQFHLQLPPVPSLWRQRRSCPARDRVLLEAGQNATGTPGRAGIYILEAELVLWFSPGRAGFNHELGKTPSSPPARKRRGIINSVCLVPALRAGGSACPGWGFHGIFMGFGWDLGA